MAIAPPEPEPRNPYFSTDIDHEAVGALEAATFYLCGAEHEPVLWRWVITALHSAVQGFMASAVRGSHGLGAFRQTDINERLAAGRDLDAARARGDAAAAHEAEQRMLFSEVKLASFLTLYRRVKADDWFMNQYMSSQYFRPRSTDDGCIGDLNSVRNEFIHFQPITRSFLLTQFPAITESGLHLISFLLNDSNNILWAAGYDRDGLKARSEVALARAYECLAAINASYADLPRPAEPLCGWTDPV